ncbi:Ubp1 protein [Scheffersomyces coipomensis]|uniref:Ubp1 protein n=1 Tax=Scheffersomyces coipomensis TaxID=1788519 RepID=UPI00315DC0EE
MYNNRFTNRGGSGNRFLPYKKSKLQRFAIKNGGVVGGISNDGNTCFMNSVIQSLASSRQFMQFIDSYLYTNFNNVDGKSQPRSDLIFTNALKTLLDNVNGKYGTRGKEFSTKPLLNKMPNGPKQNFFSGYNQEDAQEFYQLVMNILEREYKKMTSSRFSTPEPESEVSSLKQAEKFIEISNLYKVISGIEELGKLGKVYVPANQVDPNLTDSDHKVYPLELITPVDGISAERIGCLTCGEVGGIRYSVISGLSLNLPQNSLTSSYYSSSSFELPTLLNEWITPEIIEDVNCNRCGLNQTKEFLLETLQELKEKESNPMNERLIEQFSNRLNLIDQELLQPHITDEIFEKLTIKKQIKKSRKSKQIYLSRPPPLLSIHINRSVFDPRSYAIVKNPSNVTFPDKLNLTDYVVEPKDINMDARLPFRKQDERTIIADQPTSSKPDQPTLSTSNTTPPSDSSISSEDDVPTVESGSTGISTADDENIEVPNQVDPRLLYNLTAVIIHYGTHNYGHYICYRKLRGTWWRISDESVYVVDESEVLNGGQGTFMLFYEFDDGFKETLEDLSDSEPETESIITSSQEVENDDEDDEIENDANGIENGSVSSSYRTKLNAEANNNSSENVTQPSSNDDYELSSSSDEEELMNVKNTTTSATTTGYQYTEEDSSIIDLHIAEAQVHL